MSFIGFPLVKEKREQIDKGKSDNAKGKEKKRKIEIRNLIRS